MAIPLKIKAVCLSMGDSEGLRSTVMFVRWEGKPFTSAIDAVRSLVAEFRRVCAAPRIVRKACCNDVLAAKPKAKACPDCGATLTSKPRNALISDVFDRVWSADGDGWAEATDPHMADRDEEHGMLGQWRFFVGMPADCDVVNVNNFDSLIREDKRAHDVPFDVTHVGKRATRASARGRITPNDVAGEAP